MTRRPGYPTVVLIFLATHPIGTAVVLAAGWLGTHFGLTGLAAPAIGIAAQLAFGFFSSFGGPPGKVLTPAEQPELTGLVQQLAEAVDFREPLLVCLGPLPDASLGLVRIHGARVPALVLGLPFIVGLSEAQLAAVIAHELGHRQHLADRRVRRVLFVRNALAQKVAEGSVVCRLLGGKLLRRTQQLAFAHELESDAHSAEVVGSATVASALAETRLQGDFYEAVVQRWFIDLDGQEAYPVDVYEAAQVALVDPLVRTRASEEEPIQPWDSHPLESTRVSALPDCAGRLDLRSEPVPLRDRLQLETWAVAELTGGPSDGVRAVRVLDDPPALAAKASHAAEALAELAEGPSQVLSWIASATWRDHLPKDVGIEYAIAGMLSVLLSSALIERGWARVSPWISTVLIDPSGEQLDLRAVVMTALGDRNTAPRLQALAASAGLA